MNSTLVLNTTLPLTGLVDRYRQDCAFPSPSRAAAVLLERFQPYLQKWIRLLASGKWDHKDKEIRHFLQMMGSMDIEKTVQIVYLKMKVYEREDIEQEVSVVFLETALKTRSIRQHFRYALQKKVVSLLRDPLVYNHDQHLPINEAVTYAVAATDIDDLWVAGFTCGPGFDQLTPDERKILQLHHHCGFTIETTARSLGIGTATVNRVISKVKKILATHYAARRN
jgi:DNA-binding NarL/FixJ family response regulator